MDNIILMTDEFILSELMKSIKLNLIIIVMILIFLIVVGLVLFRIHKSKKKTISDVDELRKKNGADWFWRIITVSYAVVFLVAFSYVIAIEIESVFVVQYAIKNHTYAIEEYEVLDKYGTTETNIDDGTRRYETVLVLENYGEVSISEEDGDEFTIGDSVYLLFAVKGEKKNLIEIYLVGEYLYQK